MKYMGTLIAVRDIEKPKKFYNAVLGLEVAADFGANVILTGGIFLQTIETWETFIYRKEQDIIFQNYASELYFEEDHMEAFVEKLSTFSDIQYVHPMIEQGWGQCTVRFYDPDGYIIEVGENMVSVVKKFIRSGLSLEETAARMDVPVEYVSNCLK